MDNLSGPVEKLVYDDEKSSTTFDRNGNIIQEKDKYVEKNYTYNKKGYVIHNQHGGLEGEWHVIIDDETVIAYWYNKLDKRGNWLERQMEQNKTRYYAAYYTIRQVGYFNEPLISRTEIAQMKELIRGPHGERISTGNNKSGRLSMVDKKYEPTKYEKNISTIHHIGESNKYIFFYSKESNEAIVISRNNISIQGIKTTEGQSLLEKTTGVNSWGIPSELLDELEKKESVRDTTTQHPEGNLK